MVQSAAGHASHRASSSSPILKPLSTAARDDIVVTSLVDRVLQTDSLARRLHRVSVSQTDEEWLLLLVYRSYLEVPSLLALASLRQVNANRIVDIVLVPVVRDRRGGDGGGGGGGGNGDADDDDDDDTDEEEEEGEGESEANSTIEDAIVGKSRVHDAFHSAGFSLEAHIHIRVLRATTFTHKMLVPQYEDSHVRASGVKRRRTHER